MNFSDPALSATLGPPPRALVLGGGGILGAAFEIGVLTAFEERYGPGSVHQAFDLYIGASAGAFVSALVAQAISPGKIYQAFAQRDPDFFLHPHDVYSIDWKRLLRGALGFAVVFFKRVFRKSLRFHKAPLLDFFFAGLDHMPAGFLNIEGLERYLCRVFEREGLANSFTSLSKMLWIPALDIDAGVHHVFGRDPQRDPTICRAVTASSAVPELFGPVQVGNRFYVDGAMGGELHIPLAIRWGARSLMVINPIVPACTYGNDDSPEVCRRVHLEGLGAVLDHTRRIVHAAAIRRQIALVRKRHPEVPVHLVEPANHATFTENHMTYAAIPAVLEMGYHTGKSLFLQRVLPNLSMT